MSSGPTSGRPLEFFNDVRRNVSNNLKGLMCAITRKPPPGTSLLAGAVVLISTGSNPQHAKAVQERVVALGGKVTEHADAATHCIVREGLGPTDLTEHRDQLEIFQALHIVVVEPGWLDAIQRHGEQNQWLGSWRSVVVDSYVPPIVAELEQVLAAETAARERRGIRTRSPSPLSQQCSGIRIHSTPTLPMVLRGPSPCCCHPADCKHIG